MFQNYELALNGKGFLQIKRKYLLVQLVDQISTKRTDEGAPSINSSLILKTNF